MTAIIEATTGTYRSRVDGTIVLSIEIDPRFRADALALLGMPGTPVALAALKDGYAAAGGALQPPKEKIGALCLLAVQWSKEKSFWHYCDTATAFTTNIEILCADNAAEVICQVCGIDSRKELDTNPAAAKAFEVNFRKPYMAYLKENQ